MRRFITVLLISLSVFTLHGCMFDVQNAEIMRPPKLPTELEAVKTALFDYYGSGLRLMNPSSGALKAAIQFIDLNGDQQEEAVALFKDEDEQNALKVAILYKDEGNIWETLAPIVGIGYDVDQIGFPDLNGDGVKEIVVGWLGGSSLSKGLSVYQANYALSAYSGGTMVYEEIFREVYTNFHIADMDLDGADELVTFLMSRPENRAEARLYTLGPDGVSRQDSVMLSSDAHRYERMISGIVEDGRYGIVLDASLSGGATFSEALVETDGKLIRRFGVQGTSENAPTYRFDFRLTEDVDKNGWIEIPTLVSPLGYDRVAKRDVPWITQWNRWDSEENLIPVMKTYDDQRLGFRIFMPIIWNDTVTLTRNDQGIAFVEVQEDGIKRIKIFEVLVINRSDADQADGQIKSLGYFELARTMDHFYYGKTFSNAALTTKEFGMSDDQLKEAFELLN